MLEANCQEFTCLRQTGNSKELEKCDSEVSTRRKELFKNK